MDLLAKDEGDDDVHFVPPAALPTLDLTDESAGAEVKDARCPVCLDVVGESWRPACGCAVHEGCFAQHAQLRRKCPRCKAAAAAPPPPRPLVTVASSLGPCPICHTSSTPRVTLSCGHMLHPSCLRHIVRYSWCSCPTCGASTNAAMLARTSAVRVKARAAAAAAELGAAKAQERARAAEARARIEAIRAARKRESQQHRDEVKRLQEELLDAKEEDRCWTLLQRSSNKRS